MYKRGAGTGSTLALRVGAHACSFFQDERQQWSLALALVAASAENDAKCLILAEGAAIPRVQEMARDAGHAHGPSRGGLSITTPIQVFGPEPLCIDRWLERWKELVCEATAEGYASLCAIADMNCAFAQVSQLPEYEARLNELFAELPLAMLCQYDRRRYSEDLLLDALRTHPVVFVGDQPHENPYYLPRDVFLSGNARDQFCWYLSKLGQSKQDRQDASAYLPAGTEGWQVHCLGELRVLRDGNPVVWDAAHGATRRVKALFAYLLEQGRNGASKEKLADLLWPNESDLERSLSRLYHTVHALRMALEPDLASADASHYVLSDDDRYVLALPAGAFRDSEAFESLCRRGERAYKARDDDRALEYYQPAEKLYAGDLFSDIPGTCAERLDDDWCWSRRYWLRDMYLKLMLHLAEIYLRRSAIPESLHYWQRALKLDPCCEEAHRGMMRTFHCAGRPDALARQYRICENQLRRQENRSPDSQTLALWQTLISKK